MSFPYSLVIICPDSARAAVESHGLAMGYSGQEYTAPLSLTGAAPASHFGLHTWATKVTVAAFTGQDMGLTAGEAARADALLSVLTPEQITWLRATLVMSASTSIVGASHFAQAAAAQGLQMIAADAP